MSASSQAINPFISNYASVFEAASKEYKKLTKQDLRTHPFATQLDNCKSPDAVLDIFQKQAKAFDEFCKVDEGLMKWLNPIVHLLFTFSATLAEGIALPFPPAKTIFTGIGVLLGTAKDVVASHDTLVKLFERIQYFLQRLNIYNGIPLTAGMTDLLGKVMAQVLSILALSTKQMTQGRTKRYLKTLVGRSDVQNALQRLDAITQEETLMAVVRNLEVTCDINDSMVTVKNTTDELKRNQSRDRLRTWLAPPDPSMNHNIACDLQHDETGTWFIQGNAFEEWKANGSLLWIRGNPGSGKSILCSAIIEDIKCMQNAGSILVAYYYFDFKDTAKHDLRGLLSSLLIQLSNDSDRCHNILSQLHTNCGDGLKQPNRNALVKCLRNMIELPGQAPIYIIIDALDECPDNTGSPSARETVLDFLKDMVKSEHSNLYMCLTSRPEQDIQNTLNPLAPGSRTVSLHEEGGQREDILSYIRYFVQNDREMRRWRAEDKELVINALSERADGMFRWVFCQLNTLRRCIPASIRKALNELPVTLDETYARTLQYIPEEKWQHAHRLFQCLIAAIRPLRAEELAEISAIEFDPKVAPNLVEDWRLPDPEKDVVSMCSSLIVVVDVGGFKVVQFSHFSVKEFLMSHRLATSTVVNISHYHILLEPAHAILARACLSVLLQLDEKVDKKRLGTFPLAFYAAQNWVSHAEFEGVALQIQDALKRLFDPKNPYLAAWAWIHNIDSERQRLMDGLEEHPPPAPATSLYYAASCGFPWLADHLLVSHAEDVHASPRHGGTPLHVSSSKGHVDTMRLLLDHGANVNATDFFGNRPLHAASRGGYIEAMLLLLEHGSDVDARNRENDTPSHLAARNGQAEVVDVLLQHNADVNARGMENLTLLHIASYLGRTKVVQLLLDRGADVNAKEEGSTPLSLASVSHNVNNLEVTLLLLEHGADVHARGWGGKTVLQLVRESGHHKIVQLLLERGADAE